MALNPAAQTPHTFPSRLILKCPPNLIHTGRFWHARRSSTFRTLSGRTLLIKRGIPTPPSSNCGCDLQFPQGLEIDRSRPLTNTVSSYDQHVVIATGKNDWASRIENEEGIGDMARALKDMTKRTGKWFDPNRSTLISNSSFTVDHANLPSNEEDSTQAANEGASVSSSRSQSQSQAQPHNSFTSIKLFPHFLHFPLISNTFTHQSHLASTYLGSHSLSRTSVLNPPPFLPPPQPITKPTILICSHASRDARCGILGPILYSQFLSQSQPNTVDVAMISHIGGHAFAGNIIIYIPPNHPLPSSANNYAQETRMSPLAGMGIWYGRVEPRHVKSILEETVKEGNIIGELWRGGLDVGAAGDGEWSTRTASAKILRIPPEVLEQDERVIDEREP